MSDIKTNKARLSELQTGIIELFSKVASDLNAIATRPLLEVTEEDKKPHVKDMGDGLIIRRAKLHPNDLKNKAIATKDKNLTSFNLCANPTDLEEKGQELANSFISRWAGAQMFRIMPDIINETDADIQADISKSLEKAEQALKSFESERHQAESYTLFSALAADIHPADIKSDAVKIRHADEILSQITKFSRPAF